MIAYRRWLIIIFVVSLMALGFDKAAAFEMSSSASGAPTITVQVLPTPNTPSVWRMKLWIRIKAFMSKVTTTAKRALIN